MWNMETQTQTRTMNHSKVDTNAYGGGVLNYKLFSFFSHSKDPYYKFNIQARQIHQVRKSEFQQSRWPVVEYNQNFVKYFGCTRKECIQYIKNNHFVGQSFESATQALKDISSGFSTLMSFIRFLGKGERVTKDICNHTLMSVLQVVTSALNLLEGFSILKLVNFVASICQTVLNKFKGQNYEAVLLSSLSSFFPNHLMDIIKRIQLFTSSKLCDDGAMFQDIFNLIFSSFEWMEHQLEGVIPANLLAILRKGFEWTSKRFLVSKALKIIQFHAAKPSRITDPFFVKEFKELYTQWQGIASIEEWSKRSVHIKNIDNELLSIDKSIFAQENTKRKEPLMIVFDGPPGTMKSVTMNVVTDILEQNVYAHHIKSIMDGKDFYDTYNNEEIFMMDDVGQQGISQWRTFINLVSCVNYKLDCANEKKKDTKYFTSDKILVTTNNFMNLSGLCKGDGIENIGALHRRGNVIDYHHVKTVDGFLTGYVQFQHYNLETQKFEVGFTPAMKQVIDQAKFNIKPVLYLAKGDPSEVGVWAASIINILDKVKTDHYAASVARSSDLTSLRARVFKAQMPTRWSLIQEICTCMWEMLWDCLATLDLKWMGIAGALCLFLGYLYKVTMQVKEKPFYGQLDEEFSKYMSIDKKPTPVAFVEKQLFVAEFQVRQMGGPDLNIKCCVLASGRFLIAPAHGFPDFNQFCTEPHNVGHVTLIKHSSGHRVIDHAPVSIESMWYKDDVAIFGLPVGIPSYFKNMSHLIKDDHKLESPWLVTPVGSFDAMYSLKKRSSSIVYTVESMGYKNYLTNKDFMYGLQGSGLCGSILMDPISGIVGMHVAGDGHMGAAKTWATDVRHEMRKVLNSFAYTTDSEIHESKSVPSGIVLQDKEFVHVSQNSNLAPSPLYDFTEVTRRPAKLDKYGKNTVKVVGMKSFDKVQSLPSEELLFMSSVLKSIIKPYGPLTEKETVKGTCYLAGINPKSSNGYGCKPLKTDYIDFENGCFKKELWDELSDLFAQVQVKHLKTKSWLWSECLKDEIRDDRKEGEPRSFRIGRLPLQVLTKKLTGNLMHQLIEDKWSNKIMIGVNPYKDWDKIYNDLKQHDNVFDGDIGKWDGGMLPQIQHLVADTIYMHFQGDDIDRNMLDCILNNMINTPVLFKDQVIVTSHSMPSGCFWTAMFNSLVNRCYTAGWYYRNTKLIKKPTLVEFNHCVADYVYGDDKLVGVSNQASLNAVTMRDYFDSLGLSFTDANKKPITEPYSTLDEVSFLKRTFEYHPQIGRIMCPLSTNTLLNSICWVDCKKDVSVVMRDKVLAFQREIFLHTKYPRMEHLKKLFHMCEKYGVTYNRLDDAYLVRIFTDDDEMEAIPWHSSMTSKYQ